MKQKTDDRRYVVYKIIEAVRQDRALEAVKEHLIRHNTRDHTNIKLFQDEVKQKLNDFNFGYTWNVEQANVNIEQNDRIDIIGMPKENGKPIFIIEIDAARGDQVAKKLLSRITLWGEKKTVHYIALLYPPPPSQVGGKRESEKYVEYGHTVIKKFNPSSTATGIYLVGKLVNENQEGGKSRKRWKLNGEVEVWDFKDHSSFRITKKDGRKKEDRTFEVHNKSKCALAIIKDYIDAHDDCTLEQLKSVFGENVVKSERTNNQELETLLHGETIFVDTQWRKVNWHKFVIDCSSIQTGAHYLIERIWV